MIHDDTALVASAERPQVTSAPPASASRDAPAKEFTLPQDPDALVDVVPVAGTLSCSQRHVWRMVDAGLMPAPLPCGRLRRWHVGTLRQWLRDGCKPVRKPVRKVV